ncbi:LysM peptidoglycan-binding domain-containing protein [Lacticaseibacillus songhuajiangensis]|uniref:LysM peptidoglycan-binding domain-containing protein n=1 Tax=Lacticaseibacillus songhuajiangensis TaxID=1296539 RepID=UPI0013DE3C31|nr:LysM peptidoglycan-binding domain-containing protein [Lacticaseibacillus songhuajiangensis]
MTWLLTAALAVSGVFAQTGFQVSAATTSAYTVKSGDTLSEIAAAQNSTVDQLVNINGIKNKNLIMVGQQLKLSGATTKTATTTTTTASKTTYTVVSGDTISGIATKTGVSAANLISYNNLSNANMIYVGDVLKLTGVAKAATTTQAVTNTQQKATTSTNSAATQQKATTSTSTASTQKATTTTQSSSTATSSSATTSSSSSTTNKGTFKLSFYDPAVLGSNMGYSGVAANLSVFPKGTKLKITLSNGTVWYRTVNDTGSFAASNSRQLDVAMPSSQIPSAGILYATVEVIN